VLSRTDADRVLTGLTATYERVAAAIYAVDTHPALAPLRGNLVTGATLSRWRVLSPEIDLLWAHFQRLGDALERARALRAGGRPGDPEWGQLCDLLTGSTIGLAADGMPADGAATGGAAVASRVSLGELAQGLESRCASVASHLSDVESARSAVVARAVPVISVVETAATLAEELGERVDAAALRQSLAEAQRIDVDDPLAAAPGGRFTTAAEARWAGLTARAKQLQESLTDVDRLRTDYPRRLAALAELIESVAAEEVEASRSYQQAREKIVDPGLADPPDAAPILRVRLAELAPAVTAESTWRRRAEQVAVVTESARRARERAGELKRTADDLVARRNELRGRLDAYRAKAAARGLAEDEQLTVHYGQAHDLLFTAPCDLRASTRAVYAYQQTLARVLGAERSDVDD
jgi:hypothetical protein